MRTVETSSLSNGEVQSPVQTCDAAPVTAKSPQKEAVQMPNLDSFAAKLTNFAVVLSEKAKSRPVVVGNVAAIESAVDIKKVRLMVISTGAAFVGLGG